MKLTLRQQLTQITHILQSQLFPVVEQQIGVLDARARQLVATLEMIPLARFVPSSRGWIGRPSKDRYAMACAFVAKAVYGFTHTRQLLERLTQDAQLRQICGWKATQPMPHESTFSRAFDEFARMELPQFVHEALIRETQGDRLIGHIARDSTAIEAREHFPETEQPQPSQVVVAPVAAKPNKKGSRGPQKRWKGGKRRRPLNPETRLHRQRTMGLREMLDDLPRDCSIGTKTNSQGQKQSWRGYKLHLDVADGQIPISAVLTGAKVHDSQVAIPLATMTTQRVTYCYELMDAAYDAQEIREHCQAMGHVAIVDPAARGRKSKSVTIPLGKQPRQLSWAEADRYRERTMIERVNARLKDEFGGRFIRVRGAAKVMAHLMFGVLALTVDQLLRLGVEVT
jgi:Transposase DDE domain/Transposase domain (DUF772)